MKTLKLDHAALVSARTDQIGVAWSIYDDSNLSIGDKIRLVDRLPPEDSSRQEQSLEATIEQILEKRLSDLTADDYVGHATYSSTNEILAALRSEYGPQVELHTPVRIIRFTVGKPPDVDKKTSASISEIKLFADGGSRGNPGPSASGYVVTTMYDEVVVENGTYLGVTTNNQAEYQALRAGLEEAARLRVRDVHVFMDSMLVVNQMRGIFKVKNRDLWPIHDTVYRLAESFGKVTFTYIPRELNKLADAKVNEVLDSAATNQ